MYYHPSLAFEMHKVQQQERETEVQMFQKYRLAHSRPNGRRLVAGLGRAIARTGSSIVRTISRPSWHLHYRSHV